MPLPWSSGLSPMNTSGAQASDTRLAPLSRRSRLPDMTAQLAIKLIVHPADQQLAPFGVAVARDERGLEREGAVVHALQPDLNGSRVLGAGVDPRLAGLDHLAGQGPAQ